MKSVEHKLKMDVLQNAIWARTGLYLSDMQLVAGFAEMELPESTMTLLLRLNHEYCDECQTVYEMYGDHGNDADLNIEQIQNDGRYEPLFSDTWLPKEISENFQNLNEEQMEKLDDVSREFYENNYGVPFESIDVSIGEMIEHDRFRNEPAIEEADREIGIEPDEK